MSRNDQSGNKPHFSASQLSMMSRCGEQWRRRYIENEKAPPAVAMLKGTALHHGAEVNFKQKIETFKDLAKDDIIANAVEKLEATFRDDVTLTAEERKIGTKKLLHEATGEVVKLATTHAEEQAPDYQPIKVEQEFRVVMDDCDYDLLGYIDLIDDTQRVVDLKTSKAKPKAGLADESIQLTGYAAYQVTQGVYPINVRLDVLTSNKKGVKRTKVDSVRDANDLRTLGKRIDMAASAIKAGVFMPSIPGTWWCSATWCGYWETCPYVNSERKAKSELVQLT